MTDRDDWDADSEDGLQDTTEALDDDEIGDPYDVGYEPSDRWAGANRFGTTAAEERQGESLDQRLSEEEPDFGAEDVTDTDEDESTRRGWEEDPRAGRLVAEDEGLTSDDEPDSVAEDVGIDSGAATAEEAAVHVVDQPDSIGEGPDV
jgi:uncharacterized protein DUF5709